MTDPTDDTNPGHFDQDRAEAYSERVQQVIPGYDTLHDLMRLTMSSYCPADGNILVVGCGTGEEILRLGLQSPMQRFTGVDPAGAMLDIAQGRIDQTDIKGRSTLIEGRVQDVPEEPLYDAATLMLVMHFIPHQQGTDGKLALLSEIAKRLKPGAPLFVADGLGDPGDPDFDQLLDLWRDWRQLRGITDEAERKHSEEVLKRIPFVSLATQKTVLMQAGFRAITPIYQALHVHGLLAFKGAPNL